MQKQIEQEKFLTNNFEMFQNFKKVTKKGMPP